MRWLLALALLLPVNARAAALLEIPFDGGGFAEPSYGCLHGSLDCAGQADFVLYAPGRAIGSLNTHPDGLTVDLTILLDLGGSFIPPGGLPADGIVFPDLWTAGAIPVTTTADAIMQNGAYSQGTFSGSNTFEPFVVRNGVTVSGLACALTNGGNNAHCTVTFSGILDVAGHDWVHSFDVLFEGPHPPVPEPSVLGLVLLGSLAFYLRQPR